MALCLILALLLLSPSAESACSGDTGGTCGWFGCDSSRGASCKGGHCVCDSKTECAVGGRCVQHTGCDIDTGGTCSYFGCDGSRGSSCVSGLCLCDAATECAAGGRCVPNSFPALSESDLATPMTQWPMITTHDAGTGLASSPTCSPVNQINNFVVTQPRGPLSLHLQCGARALDLRPYVDDGQLKIHHGSVVIHHDYADALLDLAIWANKHPGDIIYIYVSHCQGGSDDETAKCAELLADAFASAGIKLYHENCNDLWSMTVGEAIETGRLSGGGSILASWGCVAENYDKSIECYRSSRKGDDAAVQELRTAADRDAKLQPALAFAESQSSNSSSEIDLRSDKHLDNGSALHSNKSSIRSTCYGSDSSAFDDLWEYMTTSTSAAHSVFYMAQAHWQYGTGSIAQGILRGSCILQDEESSELNKKVADKITAGEFPYINLLEVDNVCNHGPDLLRALRERSTSLANTEQDVGFMWIALVVLATSLVAALVIAVKIRLNLRKSPAQVALLSG